MRLTFHFLFLLSLLGLISVSSAATSSERILVQQDLDYSDHLLTLNNPARGVVSHKGFRLSPGNEINLTHGIVYADFMRLLIDLGAFSSNAWYPDENDKTIKVPRGVSQPLDEVSLNNVRMVLDSIRRRGGTCVIRSSYDIDCHGSQDPDLETTLTHTRQLANLYRDYEDVIHYIELGMFGTCGEMTTGSQESHAQTLQTFLENSGDNIKVGVRTPKVVAAWMGLKDPYSTWHIFPDFNATHQRFKDSALARGKYMERVGLYNDGYLGNTLDLGTYGDHDSQGHQLSRERALTWLEEYGVKVPFGGDLVCNYRGEGQPPLNTAEFFAYEGFRTHTSYVDGGMTGSCYNFMDTTTFRGVDHEYATNVKGKKYVSDHLGYRFVLRDSKIQDSVGIGGKLNLNLTIQNVGFGNNLLVNKTTLILKNGEDSNATIVELPTNIDPQKILSRKLSLKVEVPVALWDGGNYSEILNETPEFDGNNELKFSVQLPEELPQGEWKAYLRISHYGDFKTDNNFHTIQFANDSTYFDTLTHSNYVGKFVLSEKITALQSNIKANASPSVKLYNRTLNVERASRIKIFDLHGKIVMQKEVSNNAIPLNIPQGIYWVRASGANGDIIEKIRVK